jgi:integrase
MKTVMVVAGTRPEIIKMAPVVRALQKSRIPLTFVHCGQHYDYDMAQQFIEELELPPPDYAYKVKASSSGEQTARIIAHMDKLLKKTVPSLVLVEGDTNSVLATALAANKRGIPTGHVEAGLRKPDSISGDIASKIFAYTWQRTKDGTPTTTLTTYTARLRQLAKLANLNNTEEVKMAIALQNHKKGTKATTVNAYTDFLRFLGLKWQRPIYKADATLPFIPMEKELDQLITASSKRMSTLLHLLKETGARISEIARLQDIHIDIEHRTVNITASKGSNPRMLPLSTELIGKINNLPKKQDHYLFNPKIHELRNQFQTQRKLIAEKLNNTRLLRVHFHTFRHWKGTMEYHKTRDILHVKTILGHKSIESTMIYINLEQAIFTIENEDYTCKVAHNETEAIQLIETGFEYITDIDGHKLFRKRK